MIIRIVRAATAALAATAVVLVVAAALTRTVDPSRSGVLSDGDRRARPGARPPRRGARVAGSPGRPDRPGGGDGRWRGVTETGLPTGED